MLPVVMDFLQEYEVYFRPVYFLCAWLFMAFLTLILIRGIKATMKRAKVMHNIPCVDCQYFTNDHRLKCTIQPRIANTELAKDCSDFIRVENW